MLALSSLSNSSRYVGVLYAGLIFFSQAIYGVVYGDHARLAPGVDVDRVRPRQIGDAIFRLPLRYKTPLPVAVLVHRRARSPSPRVMLERRVRGVEVVA